MTMEDREVGELWKDLLRDGSGDPDGDRYARAWRVADLIRKLVEERAALHDHGDRSNDEQHADCINQALRDFGIDPATY